MCFCLRYSTPHIWTYFNRLWIQRARSEAWYENSVCSRMCDLGVDVCLDYWYGKALEQLHKPWGEVDILVHILENRCLSMFM